MSPAVSKQNQGMGVARHPRRYQRDAVSEQSFSGSDSMSLSPSPTPSARGGKKKEERMGGLALPDVVRELLKDSSVLRWDARDTVYEVVHGDNFEKRFNELRKVRNKVKASGTERPFSRMYNFFVLEQGDKWARTGTRFRPRSNVGFPSPEFLAQLKTMEGKKTASSTTAAKARSSQSAWSSRASSAAPVKSVAPIAESPAAPRHAPQAAYSSARAQSLRAVVTPAAVSRAIKPLLKSRRLESRDVHSGSFSSFSAAALEPTSIEVGAIAQSLLGKRGRAEYMMNEPILPAEMIEVTARRLRVLERDEPVEPRHYSFTPRLNSVVHDEEADGDCEEPEAAHGVDFHAASHDHDEETHEEEEMDDDEEEAEEDAVAPPVAVPPRPHAHMPVPRASAASPQHGEAAFDYDDPSDGFSSGVPSPESVISLTADFPGSPLNLDAEEGEEDDFSSFVCPPTQPSLAGKEGFIFDNLEESAWVSDSFAIW